MLKLGISRLEDYYALQPSGSLTARLRSVFTRNRISFQLLRTAMPPEAGEVKRFEAIMHTMQLNSGVYRTTARNRFHDLDRFINGLLGARYSADQTFEIQDWAASDCLTSVEWAESLFALFPKLRLVCSDLMLALIEVQLDDGSAFILQGDGEPLQYIRRPFVIRLGPLEPKWLPVNHLLARRALAKLRTIKTQIEIPAGWLESPGETLPAPPFQLRKIHAVHPEAQALQARDGRFLIRRHSVFEALQEPVDVIRTMNIFNRIYFSDERLLAGAQAVWSSLKPGGLWIVGRTWSDNPPTNHATVLERTADGFQLVEKYGEGSEIVPLVVKRAFEVQTV